MSIAEKDFISIAIKNRRSAMINHGEETLTMGLTPTYTLPQSEKCTSVIEQIPIDEMPDTEDPFKMGRTLLVLAMIELIIGLGIYRYFS